MVEKVKFQLHYDGNALNEHEFDPLLLSSTLKGMHDAFKATNALFNQDKAKSKVTVIGDFKAGSFGIDFNLSVPLLESVKDLFNSDTTTAILNASGIFGLVIAGIKTLIFLKGKDQDKVVKDDEGNFLVYKGNDYIKVPEKTLELIRDIEFRKAIKELSKPLLNEGIETCSFLDLKHKDKPVTYSFNKSESRILQEIPTEEKNLTRNTIRMILLIIKPSFDRELSWEFKDDDNKFHAKIEDELFLQELESRDKTVHPGDYLDVELEVEQKVSGNKIKTHRKIIKVNDVTRTPSNLSFQFEE